MRTACVISTVGSHSAPIDLSGFSPAGIWVRRVRSIPSLGEEALALAAILQTWDLKQDMMIELYDGVFAEISGPDLQPTWLYLVEVVGIRTSKRRLYANHPLAGVGRDEPVRLVAMVSRCDFLIPGVMIETDQGRRMIWLQAALPALPP